MTGLVLHSLRLRSVARSIKDSFVLEPDTQKITGTLKYLIPNPGTSEVVFNLNHNAYRSGSTGGFYFANYSDRIFTQGDSSGGVEISKVTVNQLPAVYSLEDTTLSISLKEQTGHTLVVEFSFALTAPRIAHRNGAHDQALWLGNWLTAPVHRIQIRNSGPSRVYVFSRGNLRLQLDGLLQGVVLGVKLTPHVVNPK